MKWLPLPPDLQAKLLAHGNYIAECRNSPHMPSFIPLLPWQGDVVAVACCLLPLMQGLTKMINATNESNAASKAQQSGGNLAVVSQLRANDQTYMPVPNCFHFRKLIKQHSAFLSMTFMCHRSRPQCWPPPIKSRKPKQQRQTRPLAAEGGRLIGRLRDVVRQHP